MTGIALLTYALEVAADHEPEKNLKGAIANVLDLASGFDQTLREAKLDVMRIEEQEVEFEREILAAARGGSTNTYVTSFEENLLNSLNFTGKLFNWSSGIENRFCAGM